MNNLIESICEDNQVRYTRVKDSHFSVQRKDGYILLRELKIEPFKCSTRPFRTLKLSAVCYCMFSSPEDFFKHLEISSIADEDWVISDETNIKLEPFENLYTTIL